jgi:hypothetical protein
MKELKPILFSLACGFVAVAIYNYAKTNWFTSLP